MTRNIQLTEQLLREMRIIANDALGATPDRVVHAAPQSHEKVAYEALIQLDSRLQQLWPDINPDDPRLDVERSVLNEHAVLSITKMQNSAKESLNIARERFKLATLEGRADDASFFRSQGEGFYMGYVALRAIRPDAPAFPSFETWWNRK